MIVSITVSRHLRVKFASLVSGSTAKCRTGVSVPRSTVAAEASIVGRHRHGVHDDSKAFHCDVNVVVADETVERRGLGVDTSRGDATIPEQDGHRPDPDRSLGGAYIKCSLLCGGFVALSVGGAMWFFTATSSRPMARWWAGVAAGSAGFSQLS